MKKHYDLIICFAFILSVLVCTSSYVCAISTDSAAQEIDVSRTCDLTISCTDTDAKPAESVDIKLYYIASVSSDFTYTVSDSLSDCSININGIDSTDEWDSIMQTADAYITVNCIEPAYSLTTDNSGSAAVSCVPLGLYYIVLSGTDPAYFFPSYMLSLPSLTDDGTWEYNVVSIPKSRIPEKNKTSEIMIVKQWKDGNGIIRPEDITVDVYCDGDYYKTVTLGAENDWSCKLSSDGTHEWIAAEKNVPENYSVRIEKENGTIVITNILSDTPPATGDKGIAIPLIILFCSGAVIVFLGIISAIASKHDKK